MFISGLSKRFVVLCIGDDDLKRRGYILNVILLGSTVLTGAALINNLIEIIFIYQNTTNYQGVSAWILAAIFIFLVGLYKLSRSGHVNEAGYAFIFLLLLPTSYTAYVWSPLVPQALLTFALIIVMSGIIINKRTSLFVTILIASFAMVLNYLQISSLYNPDLSWIRYDSSDIIVSVLTLFLIMIISWLSNREIERSLERAHKSEQALKKEKDLLEIRVAERTRELEETQAEKIAQLHRFSEFGRISSGVFHDMMNPLTALSLNLQELKKVDDKGLGKIKEHLKDAFQANKRMQDYIGSIRKQLSQKDEKKYFYLEKEIEKSQKMLAYKATDKEVKVRHDHKREIRYFGDPIKFQKIVTNLISNAIDSYEKKTGVLKKEVLIELSKDGKNAVIAVKDWGIGIDKNDIGHIFDPFFTTKETEKGMGIGLSIIKEAVENDFKGSISVSSDKGKGSTFIVTLPIKKASKNKTHARKY